MRIVYLSSSILPSRAANSVHVMKMCNALAANGHDVTLIAIDGCSASEERHQLHGRYGVDESFDIVLRTRPSIWGKYLFYSLRSAYRAARLSPDLVYGRDVMGLFIAALLGCTVILESHAPFWNESRYLQIAHRLLFRSRRLKRLVLISNALKNLYEANSDIGDCEVLVAHDSADPPVTDAAIDLGESSTLSVGYVGGLYSGKGVEVVEHVAPKLPGVTFHVVGGEDADVERWKEKISSPNVCFHGYVRPERVSEYMNAFDVCILPNQKSVMAHGAVAASQSIASFTSPLKLFEYMAHGKPIVASDMPVIREVVDEGFAVLVQCDDWCAWADAFKRMDDPELRNKLGNQARKEFRAQYTWRMRAEAVIGGL